VEHDRREVDCLHWYVARFHHDCTHRKQSLRLLSQWLSIVATGDRYEDPKSVFKYEMGSYPSALFDSSLLPSGANKLALADAIWANTKTNQTAGPTGNVHFVLDGGTLLHHVSWPRDFTDILCSLLPVCPVRRLQVWQGHSCVWWISEWAINKGQHPRRTAGVYVPTATFESSCQSEEK